MTATLAGGVGVVVGGAGTGAGLGQGLVRELAARGMRVAILDVDDAAAAALAVELRADGVEVTSCAVDVRDGASIEAAAAHVLATFGACNVLCCHVGSGTPGRIDQLSTEQWRDAFEIGLLGAVATVQAFLPLLRDTPGTRRIVLTSSVAALAPGRFQGPYRATKAAVTSFGETLDLELGPEGIGTTIVFPSGMATAEALDGLDDAGNLDAALEGLPEEWREIAVELRNEMASHPTDLAVGRAAARPVVDAVVEGRRYVITHGATVEQHHRARLRLLDDAFDEVRSRGYRAAPLADVARTPTSTD